MREGQASLVIVTSVFLLFWSHGVDGSRSGEPLIPKQECNKISGVEVRYNEFYELYLGHDGANDELQKQGIVYRCLSEAVEACCPGMTLNFTLVNASVEYLVEEDILHHHGIRNTSHLVFYFPEFTTKKDLEVYSHKVPFLKLRKSPGFALVMLRSESHLDISASDIITPSWPIFALVLSLSWAVGIVGWFLEHCYNSEQFRKPFVRGMFDGFWWALVTMTTVGYGDKTPKTILARILCVIWILAGAVLLSLFTANTTSIITESRIKKNAQTVGKKIGLVNMKQFVEAELNLGAQIIEFPKVELALEALRSKEIDRLLFPHYLDLLYLMSKSDKVSLLSPREIYIVKEMDKSFQIGMVLSHAEASIIQNVEFYTCLEVMTSRFSSKYAYDYSLIDGSIVDNVKDTFDTKVTLQFFFVILGIIGLMFLIGAAWDIYHLYRDGGVLKINFPDCVRRQSRPV
ncbi:uncharacterized protein LOC114537528 isoform X1 [Dendronephthya gigantea]|uniref:uncharacterized protein LOC114537528 isoform X1 n=2 Tax=Dendronephthya gigantea TaxID=151771 RepID=UPI00106B5CDA|nr:uncharacterized protein LOC114537528 isoform X1 [Dendronephthya gigantea]XP_028414375.1 uncharacterized protein LOC114537528 isoform X1 [Dendronephthya gigantea]